MVDEVLGVVKNIIVRWTDMEDNWKYVKTLENRDAVRLFLEKYRIDLPRFIVQTIETYNGGRPSNKHIFTSANREYVFKTLLSYNKNDKETIYSVYPEPFRKLGLFPIASDTAGNYVCFDVTNRNWVLYNHESDQVESVLEMAIV